MITIIFISKITNYTEVAHDTDKVYYEMEEKDFTTEKTYVENLNDAMEVLIGIVPTEKDWDNRILRAIRNLNEIKYYFKNGMELQSYPGHGIKM